MKSGDERKNKTPDLDVSRKTQKYIADMRK